MDPIMNRKIYFAGSIRGGRQDVALYHNIINELKTNYGAVLTEFVGDEKIDDEFEDKVDDVLKFEKSIHDRDIEMLKQCQYLVAEVTQVSMGVGYEIGRATAMGKSVLCLYRPGGDKKLSAMIRGAANETTFIVKDYTDLPEAFEILKNYFSSRS